MSQCTGYAYCAGSWLFIQAATTPGSNSPTAHALRMTNDCWACSSRHGWRVVAPTAIASSPPTCAIGEKPAASIGWRGCHARKARARKRATTDALASAVEPLWSWHPTIWINSSRLTSSTDHGFPTSVTSAPTLMGSGIDTELVLNALVMALWRRQPKVPVLVHANQGSQYTGHDWQTSCAGTN